MKGKFIVFEGIDGAGTTTQAKRLSAKMGTIFTFEPTDHPIGKMIRRALSSGDDFFVSDRALALLFAADRREHNDRILESLVDGVTVISDRYHWSSLIYQGLTCSQEWIANINDPIVPPDLTILLDIEPEIAATRRAKRNDDHEDIFDDQKTQAKLRAAYQSLAYLYPHPVAIIDGSGDEEAVARAVNEAVSRIPS